MREILGVGTGASGSARSASCPPRHLITRAWRRRSRILSWPHPPCTPAARLTPPAAGRRARPGGESENSSRPQKPSPSRRDPACRLRPAAAGAGPAGDENTDFKPRQAAFSRHRDTPGCRGPGASCRRVAHRIRGRRIAIKFPDIRCTTTTSRADARWFPATPSRSRAAPIESPSEGRH